MEAKAERSVTAGKWTVTKLDNGVILLQKVESREIPLSNKDYGELSTAMSLFDAPPQDFAKVGDEWEEDWPQKSRLRAITFWVALFGLLALWIWVLDLTGK